MRTFSDDFANSGWDFAKLNEYFAKLVIYFANFLIYIAKLALEFAKPLLITFFIWTRLRSFEGVWTFSDDFAKLNEYFAKL